MPMPGENVTQWFDNLKLNKFHVLVLFLTGLTLVFDGFDSQVVAYIMPQVLKEWNLTPIEAGSLASYGFLGLMVGAAGFGALSDRIGRKKALIMALLVFSVFSGCAYFAPDFKVFVTLRFFAGLGMGGAMPIAITLVSEFAPARIRGKAVTAMFGGFTLGWAVAAAAAMAIVPSFGWRLMLLIGFLPALFVIFLWLYLPESVRFLSSKQRYEEAVVELRKIERVAGLERINWSPADLEYTAALPRSNFRELFRPGLVIMTLLVWITYFCNLLIIYGLSSWLPSLLVKSGFSLVKSYSFGMIQAVGASAGGFVLGWVMDRFGRKAGLIIFYIIGGFAIWFFGFTTSNTMLYIAGAATGLFVIGTQIAQHVVTGEIYPTHARSTGVGWALTVGRMGAITGPIFGGWLLMAGFNFSQYFMIFAIPSFICALLVSLYRVNVKGDALEIINEKLKAI